MHIKAAIVFPGAPPRPPGRPLKQETQRVYLHATLLHLKLYYSFSQCSSSDIIIRKD